MFCLFVVFVVFDHVIQAEKLGDKRLSEQATKRLKDQAAAAIRRRERALYEAREAAVREKERERERRIAAAAFGGIPNASVFGRSREASCPSYVGWMTQRSTRLSEVSRGAVGRKLSVESSVLSCCAWCRISRASYCAPRWYDSIRLLLFPPHGAMVPWWVRGAGCWGTHRT